MSEGNVEELAKSCYLQTQTPYAYNTRWKCNLPLKISLSLCLKMFLSVERVL